MSDKYNINKIYSLIDDYLTGKISVQHFCDEFYYAYDLELDRDGLSEIEKKTFSEISRVTSRFSQYKEDHNLDQRAFTTQKEVDKVIIEANNKLSEAEM